jgi:voltage-gated sodium channel
MDQYPYAWSFFVPFILIATFTMLNLFIGIIVNTMQTIHEQENEKELKAVETIMHADTSQLSAQIQQLREDIASLRTSLKKTEL